MSAIKQIMTESGEFVDVDDCWYCPECGFQWAGKDRAPPYPHCPECDYHMLRRCR